MTIAGGYDLVVLGEDKAADAYRYLNFDQIPEYAEVAKEARL